MTIIMNRCMCDQKSADWEHDREVCVCAVVLGGHAYKLQYVLENGVQRGCWDLHDRPCV